MLRFETISPRELSGNPFQLLQNDWALLTAGDSAENYNTMTVSWGGLGVLWNKNVVTVYVRPQRYTYEFMENSDHFTLSFFESEWKKALSFCGSKSGRDVDKAKECGFTPVMLDGGISFEESRLVFSCKKLYYSDIIPSHLLDASLEEANYPNKDYHRIYIGEIINAYQK